MTILATTDFSDNARAGLRAAAAEARRRHTTLTLLHCVDSVSERWDYLDETPTNLDTDVRQQARDRLREEYDEAVPRDKQPKVDEFRVVEDHAAQGIVEVESAGDFELVVIGATGSGTLARLLLGSTAEEVVRSSETPVLVVPGDSELDAIDRILAPIDLSECSRASLMMAAECARAADAELSILHASSLPAGALALMEWEPSEEDKQAHRKFTSEQMADFLQGIDFEGIEPEQMLRFGAPFQEIVEVADDEQIDLIVMGTHGRRGFERLFMGSTATKVLRRLPCPATTIRSKPDE